MRVLVTGASGWIGRAVVPELLDAGHQVVGLARSDRSTGVVAASGAEVLRGDLADLDALRAGATAADAVVHLAFDHDFTRFAEAVKEEARVIDALGAALAGTGGTLVVASGTPVVPGGVAGEGDEGVGGGPAAARVANARSVVGLAERGVRSAVVRLPRSVHGDGDHGFVAQLVGLARDKGVAGHVGDGAQRWPAAHVLDTARLFRLAVERAPAGSVLHAVGDQGVPVRTIAEVIGRHLGLPVASLPAEDFGFLGGLLAIDQPASSSLTQRLLDWHPTRPGLVEDLDSGHYFA